MKASAWWAIGFLIAASGCSGSGDAGNDGGDASDAADAALADVAGGDSNDVQPSRDAASDAGSDTRVADGASDAADASSAGDTGGNVDSGVDAGGATDAGSDAGRNCTAVRVEPGTDVTAALRSALTMAAANPVAGLVGPSGQPQGRVYLPAGTFAFGPIQMVSNVRIEIEPGATLRPLAGSDGPGAGDWGLITFGTATAPARNVSIVAGDGCGGPGAATSANKPSNTNFRGNDPNNGGMGNAAVPFNSYWPTDRMWVFDIDPRATGCNVEITGLMFHWAYDVLIQNVFTIQNAERDPSPTVVAPVAGATSRTTAMMFDPLNGTQYTSVVEDQQLPHRITVDWHYNILSPSGQGSNQVRACRDCTFTNVFSHGGDALRLETDGIPNTCADGTCGCTGANGQGFGAYAIVDNLTADHIEGAFGNRSVQLTPHCLPNGSATISNVRGTSQAQVVAMVGTQADAPNGSFSNVTLRDVTGCGGPDAQEAHPQQDSYLLINSVVAIQLAANYATFGGTFSWPSPPDPGGLMDGNLPSGGGYTVVHPHQCTTTF